ncbi:SDR family NAD(P)-dependent oxidoreductase [Streptomyces sp. NPDC050844]|uniref:SDR family NAD(P)-dependent oxidoreductase n=1 Tax=Streptomyces sp. NPDC050844 TaxID=3155790 RepID=UPI0033CA5927
MHQRARPPSSSGAGPGLGMSIAHRFGREGHTVALVSRSDTRHSGYVAALAGAGVEAGAFVADVRDREQLIATLDAIAERYGTIDLVYYGPGAVDPDARPKPITETDSRSAQEAMSMVYPAIDVANKVLPGMLERGTGGLLFAGGLSAVTPMPPLGAFAVSSAALHNYALTLNAAVADKGIHVASLIIGGLIERGDIYRSVTSQPETFGDVGSMSLDPDAIADTAWEMHSKGDRAEAVFSAFG